MQSTYAAKSAASLHTAPQKRMNKNIGKYVE